MLPPESQFVDLFPCIIIPIFSDYHISHSSTPPQSYSWFRKYHKITVQRVQTPVARIVIAFLPKIHWLHVQHNVYVSFTYKPLTIAQPPCSRTLLHHSTVAALYVH